MYKIKKISQSKNKGFTLIELLIVVSVLGILGGVLTTVINPKVQRAKAQDSVYATNIQKLAEGIEAYYITGNGVAYPAEDPSGSLSNVIADPNNNLSKYIATWPTDAAYEYRVSSDSTNACLSVPMASDPDVRIKYVFKSSTSGACSGRVVRDCTYSCYEGSSFNTNLDGCNSLTGNACN
ncbi:type II secretion system protein [Candidatus Nomurabacteria bacterium]|nr:type II secretion system protein [Candidatus Nomurabacteria bacterium]MCB9827203.1 type II secretion system protein [Candidatus Nomurabacteria bacterium]MCB9827513.1 type II secretion system protein [Candidatus Nomurabacteria bacterium]HXK52572.1 type II secretion system protein [bacterium]